MYKKNQHPHEKPLVVKSVEGKKTNNPNELTVNQHVLPQAHLKEWSRKDGLLNVFDKQKGAWFTPAPVNAFTVQRLWDQWTETSFLGSNERNYQDQAQLVKTWQPIENHDHISAYFFMLCIRAWVAAKERPDSGLIMKLSSPPLTQGELEDIELENVDSPVHMSSPGGEGSQALARDVVKMAMNMRFGQGIRKFAGMIWTPFAMGAEDAVFPDSFVQLDEHGLAILPVTPKIVLVGAAPGKDSLNDFDVSASVINRKLIDSSVRYYVSVEQTRP